MDNEQPSKLQVALSSMNMPFALWFRHSQGERYLHAWRLFPAVLLCAIIYALCSMFAHGNKIELYRSGLLVSIFSIVASLIYIHERIKLFEKEKLGEHTISTYSGTPRFLPFHKISWFVGPVLFVFIALYDMQYFHWARPFTMFMGIFGVIAILETIVQLYAQRAMTLMARDADLISKYQSFERKEFGERSETEANNTTEDLIRLFS